MADTPRVTLSPATKDFRTLRQELFARAPIITNGRWTDLNESDIGVGLAEMLVGMSAQQLFYLDKQANEGFLPTAVQRRNVANLLKLIGYELRGFASSSGAVTFSVATGETPVFPIPIPRGTTVAGSTDSGENILFFTTEDSELLQTPTPSGVAPALAGAITVPAIQGESLSDEVFQSDGSADQRFVLNAEQVNKDLLTVKVGSTSLAAVTWTAVDSLINYEENDEVYVAFIDPEGNAQVQFGDGKFGVIPSLGQNIYIAPVAATGEAGNLAANTVTRVISEVLDGAGQPVALTVTNQVAMTGGANPESIEDGKRQGPALFAALFRAMSKADYIALTDGINGVVKANAWGEQEERHPDIRLINRVTVSFLAVSENNVLLDPDDAGDPAVAAELAAIKKTIYDLLEERKPITTRIVFKEPEWVDVLSLIRIAVDRTFYDPVIVAGDVELAVKNFWSFDNVSFDQDARLSQLSQVVQSVPGVSWAEVRLGRFQIGETPPPAGLGVPTIGGWPLLFQDIPVSRWELIRVKDFDDSGAPTLGVDTAGQPILHVQVVTTTSVNAPEVDPLPDPCDVDPFTGG